MIFRQTEEAEENLPAHEKRIQAELQEQHQWFAITPHKPNYILPATYNFNANYDAYGENMIDMENRNIRVGVGLSLLDWP